MRRYSFSRFSIATIITLNVSVHVPNVSFPAPQQFEWNGELKDISSSFVGVSPEFEFALYTLVFLMDQVC